MTTTVAATTATGCEPEKLRHRARALNAAGAVISFCILLLSVAVIPCMSLMLSSRGSDYGYTSSDWPVIVSLAMAILVVLIIYVAYRVADDPYKDSDVKLCSEAVALALMLVAAAMNAGLHLYDMYSCDPRRPKQDAKRPVENFASRPHVVTGVETRFLARQVTSASQITQYHINIPFWTTRAPLVR